MISERMKKEMQIRGWNMQQLADVCNLPLETIRNIYYGKSVDPKLSTALKIADAFQLSVNCLIGKCPHTLSERTLIENYRSCGKHGKSIIDLIARYEAGATKVERENNGKHKIPCLFPQGDIRKGIIYDLCETNDIQTEEDDAYIGIQMTNNDLTPYFCKGDILLFEDRFPRNGEIASFLKGERAYIRKFIEEDGQYRLKCLHGHGEDIVVRRMDEIDYIGTFLDVVRA